MRIPGAQKRTVSYDKHWKIIAGQKNFYSERPQ